MKTKLLLFVIGSAAVMQFSSCKKDAAVTKPVSSNNNGLVSETVKRGNLVAWYKFTKGAVADYSSYSNNLTAVSTSLTSDFMERPNNAYYFNGSGSYMFANDAASLSPSTITLAALVKPAGFYAGSPSSSRILMKGTDDQSNGVYFLGFNSDGTAYGNYGDNQFNSNGVATAPGTIQLDNWYKLIYTYDGNVGKLYVNGILAAKKKKTASFFPNTSPLRIGVTGRVDFPFWFNGAIDEIRIYDIALSQNQVSTLNSELGE